MISVRRTDGLPQTSFRFHLTADTLVLLAMCFPLTGALRTFTFKINARAERTDADARSTRGLVLQLKTREFVVASETLGASSGWIIARRLIPNTLGIRVVSITMSLPSVIFYEAFLSYIGLGVTPPQPSWGQLIKAAGETFRYYPYQFIIPCLCVSISSLGGHPCLVGYVLPANRRT